MVGIKRIEEGLASGNGALVLAGINEHLRIDMCLDVPSIVSLDDITTEHVQNQSRLERALGYAPCSPNDLKRALIEKGVLGRDLAGYTVAQQAHIVRTALESTLTRTVRTAYFSDVLELPRGPRDAEDFLEENRRKLVGREEFKELMESRGWRTLDDIRNLRGPRKRQSDMGLHTLLGFPEGDAAAMRARLIELGYFPLLIKQYTPDLQAKIYSDALAQSRERNKTPMAYFDPALDPDVLESNRRMLVLSAPFGAMLKEEGIFTLDDILTTATGDMRAIGVTQSDARALKEVLASYGRLPRDLREYGEGEPRHDMAERIGAGLVRRRGASNWKSEYFRKDLPQDVIDANRDELLRSVPVQRFLDEALERHQHKEVRKLLAKMGYAKGQYPQGERFAGYR